MKFSKQPKETGDTVLSSQENNILSPSPSLERASIKGLYGSIDTGLLQAIQPAEVSARLSGLI